MSGRIERCGQRKRRCLRYSVCRGGGDPLVECIARSSQSFPSGHASTAFCGLIFLAVGFSSRTFHSYLLIVRSQLYIHKVWNYRNIGLFPYVMQMLCFALASYIGEWKVNPVSLQTHWYSLFAGITRITDNRHHATDVLSGAILGTVVAIIGVSLRCRSLLLIGRSTHLVSIHDSFIQTIDPIGSGKRINDGLNTAMRIILFSPASISGN